MAVTEFVDIVSKRPIPAEDIPWLENQIEQAEAVLEIKRGDLLDYIAAGVGAAEQAKRTARVKMVVNRMVLRVVKNPDGLYSEADGDYSYSRDKSLGSGEVYASSRDLALVGVTSRRRVSSMRLHLPADSPRNMTTGSC